MLLKRILSAALAAAAILAFAGCGKSSVRQLRKGRELTDRDTAADYRADNDCKVRDHERVG